MINLVCNLSLTNEELEIVKKDAEGLVEARKDSDKVRNILENATEFSTADKEIIIKGSVEEIMTCFLRRAIRITTGFECTEVKIEQEE